MALLKTDLDLNLLKISRITIVFQYMKKLQYMKTWEKFNSHMFWLCRECKIGHFYVFSNLKKHCWNPHECSTSFFHSCGEKTFQMRRERTLNCYFQDEHLERLRRDILAADEALEAVREDTKKEAECVHNCYPKPSIAFPSSFPPFSVFPFCYEYVI